MLAKLGKLILLSNHVNKTKTFHLHVTKTRVEFTSTHLTYGFNVNLPNIQEINCIVWVDSNKLKTITTKHELVDVSVVDTDVVFVYKYERLLVKVNIHILNDNTNPMLNFEIMDKEEVSFIPTVAFSAMVKKHEYNSRTMCNGVWLNLEVDANKSAWIFPIGAVLGPMGLPETDFPFMFHYNFERVRELLGKNVSVTKLLYLNCDNNNKYGVEYSDGTVYKLHETTNNMPRAFLEFLDKFKSYYSLDLPLMLSYPEFDSIMKMVKLIHAEHKKSLDKRYTVGIRFTFDNDKCVISKYDYKRRQDDVIFEKGIKYSFDEPLSKIYGPENLIYIYDTLKNKKSFVEIGIGSFNRTEKVIVVKQDNILQTFLPYNED